MGSARKHIMKFLINKEAFDKLSEELQKEYTEKEGNFTLKLEGHEEHFVPAHKKAEAEKHRKAAEDRADAAEATSAKLVTDLEAAKGTPKEAEQIRADLIKTHQADMAKLQEDNQKELATLKGREHAALIEVEASAFATEFSTVPALMKGVMAKRLTVGEANGLPILQVLDTDGKVSNSTIADLRKEILANHEYKPILIGTKANGGGANPADLGNPGSAGQTITGAEFTAKSDQDRMAFSKDGGKVVD